MSGRARPIVRTSMAEAMRPMPQLSQQSVIERKAVHATAERGPRGTRARASSARATGGATAST